MAIEFNWSFIPETETMGETENVVVSVLWKLTGVDEDGFTYFLAERMKTEAFRPDSFIVLDDLTEDNYKNWTLKYLHEGEETEEETVSRLENKLTKAMSLERLRPPKEILE